MSKAFCQSLLLTIVLCAAAAATHAQTTEFTYQGRLMNSAVPASGNYDFEFRLYDAATAGALLGTQTRTGVAVTNGVFTVRLDYGNVFEATGERWIDITVRVSGGGAYTPLNPRQPITSAPLATRANTATNADQATNAVNAENASNANLALNSQQLGGLAAAQFVTTNDSRLSDPRAPLAGSANYVQNTTTQQTGSFNISGSGTAGTLSATSISANNINGSAISGGFVNMTTVIGGTVNTTGSYNVDGVTFLNGGVGTTPQSVHLGLNAGAAVNDAAARNIFIGYEAGLSSTSFGDGNTAVGESAGRNTVTGQFNSFFGQNAGRENTGTLNSYFGTSAGRIGTGTNNTFIGFNTGLLTTGNAGSYNTLLGTEARIETFGLTYATAIGAGSTAFTSNSITLGRQSGADFVFIPGRLLLDTLDTAGPLDVCRNANGYLSTCSSSARYKNTVQDFTAGLDYIRRLRPVTFNWNSGGARDLGFMAEEVEKIDPLLSTYNDKGEVEGVKYKQLTTVLVNAIKEQQTLIERQQQQIDALRKLVCAQNGEAEICK